MTATMLGPVERVAALRLLALALAPPSAGTLEYVALLAGALDERGVAEARAVLDAVAVTGSDDVAAAHERLFGGEVAVPPYEGSYEADPFRQARQLSDVAGFYRAFGTEAHGPAAERPDHAGSQLEFLSYLGALALEGGEEADRCRAIEASFLTDHAGRWLPVFFASLESAATSDYHRAVARLGSLVLDAAIADHGLAIEPVRGRAGRSPVQADELECGAP